MSYQELTQYNSPNYTPESQVPYFYGMPRTIDGITYHWWGDPAQQPQFDGIVNWLCRPNGNSSAHVVGEAGRIAWIIDANNAAWHAGNARGNATTVGYECNPRLEDGDYEVMGEFHYDMEKAYGKRLPIYVHKEWFNTSCSPIDKGRIRAVADRYHQGVPTVSEQQIRTLFLSILEREPDTGGMDHYKNQAANGWTVDQIKADILGSAEYKTLQERKQREAEEAAKPEWIKNRHDEVAKLSVLPAAGARVLNFTTGKPVNDSIIPKGTQIDVMQYTTVGGTKYYISSFAKSKGLPFGILATDLGTPAVKPEREKPEWLKNLKDIADVDMWTRSETPVLRLEDGNTQEILPINAKVRITHSTHLVDNDLMVLEGGKLAIQTVYLSDKPIPNPNDDLEKRVGILEKLVKAIVDFLSGLFKNFNK